MKRVFISCLSVTLCLFTINTVAETTLLIDHVSYSTVGNPVYYPQCSPKLTAKELEACVKKPCSDSTQGGPACKPSEKLSEGYIAVDEWGEQKIVVRRFRGRNFIYATFMKHGGNKRRGWVELKKKNLRIVGLKRSTVKGGNPIPYYISEGTRSLGRSGDTNRVLTFKPWNEEEKTIVFEKGWASPWKKRTGNFSLGNINIQKSLELDKIERTVERLTSEMKEKQKSMEYDPFSQARRSSAKEAAEEAAKQAQLEAELAQAEADLREKEEERLLAEEAVKLAQLKSEEAKQARQAVEQAAKQEKQAAKQAAKQAVELEQLKAKSAAKKPTKKQAAQLSPGGISCEEGKNPIYCAILKKFNVKVTSSELAQLAQLREFGDFNIQARNNSFSTKLTADQILHYIEVYGCSQKSSNNGVAQATQALIQAEKEQDEEFLKDNTGACIKFKDGIGNHNMSSYDRHVYADWDKKKDKIHSKLAESELTCRLGEKMTFRDLRTIDAMARTIYSEVRSVETEGGSESNGHYIYSLRAIGDRTRFENNKVFRNNVRKRKEPGNYEQIYKGNFARKKGESERVENMTPEERVLSKRYQFSVWNPQVKDHGNLSSTLCPKKESPKRWDLAVKLSREAYCDPKNFKEKYPYKSKGEKLAEDFNFFFCHGDSKPGFACYSKPEKYSVTHIGDIEIAESKPAVSFFRPVPRTAEERAECQRKK